MLRRAPLFALLALGHSACSLYVGDDDKDAGAQGAADASVPIGTEDARPTDPECPLSDEGATAGLSACMAYEDWEAAGLCSVPLMNTGEGTCASCHSGESPNGITLETDCAVTFDAMKTWPRQNDLVAPVTDDRDCFTGFEVGRICGAGLPDSHPPFVCPNDIAAALDTFIQENLSSWQAGTCGSDG